MMPMRLSSVCVGSFCSFVPLFRDPIYVSGGKAICYSSLDAATEGFKDLWRLKTKDGKRKERKFIGLGIACIDHYTGNV